MTSEAEPRPDAIAPGALTALLEELCRAEARPLDHALPAMAPGRAVGRFEVVRELGRGGFGVVYEARDRELGRSVALKVVRPGARLPRSQDRLWTEAEAAARLSHPNIVTLHDAGRCDDGPYLVFELLHGEPLASRLAPGAIPPGEAVRILAEVARGVAHAHAHGVVHRDLTPANVFLCDDGLVKVLDFGLAHAFGQPKLDGGTRPYMAPEQARGAPEDERTDVFALGVILYRMLTGELPFTDDRRALLGPRAAPALTVDGFPTLGPLLERMLAKDPVSRPRHGGEVLSALEQLLHERREPPAPHAGRVAVRRRRLAPVVAGLALLGAVVGAAGVALHATRGGAAARGTPSVAVLPFTDLSPGRDQEYFSDGVAEEILIALTRLDGLRVVGRSSSFAFRGRSEDLRSIGRKLDVAAVLEGSVRRDAQRVRVTAQLTSVADGYSMWSETFDRELTGVFAIQDEIARAVVDALQVKLLPGTRPSSGAHATSEPEAYRYYLLGRQLYVRHTDDGHRRAADAYEKALALDPGYAPARAWLAVVLRDLSNHTDDAEASARLRARALAEAEEAVRLAPDLADGYSARGVLRIFWTRDLAGARADLQRAVALRPGDPASRRRLAIARATEGELAQAVEELRRAVDLDPLDTTNWIWLGVVEGARGRLDAARVALLRALEISPENENAHLELARVDVMAGAPAAALEHARACREEDRLAITALAEHDLGHGEESQRALDRLVAKYAHNGAGWVAVVHAWRGEPDLAFEWLDRAAAQEVNDIAYDPLLKPLHRDPRWAPLLRRLGLPVAQP